MQYVNRFAFPLALQMFGVCAVRKALNYRYTAAGRAVQCSILIWLNLNGNKVSAWRLPLLSATPIRMLEQRPRFMIRPKGRLIAFTLHGRTRKQR
jgi:hypothetical protein